VEKRVKTKLETNLEDILNLPESSPIVEPVTDVIVPSNIDDKTLDNDYKYARENLYEIIERGSDALNTLVEIAQASQSARAFEVVGTLVKTLSDANKDLLEITNKVKKIKEETKTSQKNITNNSLFVGSTAELQKFLKNNDR
jgi:hypothetical protein